MKATICDRCHKTIEQNAFDMEVNLVLGHPLANAANKSSYVLKRDLCQRCYDELKRWISESPAERASAA